MKIVVIYSEGKSSVIFLSSLLKTLFEYKVNIDCIKLRSDNHFSSSNLPSYSNPSAKIRFQLIDAGSDEAVLSAIKKNATRQLSLNFDFVCGLRDMYSRAYNKKSNGKINQDLFSSLIRIWQKRIGANNQIKLFVSIMELEAWFLAFVDIIQEMGLPISFNNNDLNKIDPEHVFYHPKTILEKIYNSTFSNKKFSEADFAYSFSSKLRLTEINNVVKSGKVSKFVELHSFLTSL